MRRMLPEDTFTDRVAIVTGGGSGIGQGIAEMLASLGAKIVIASRKQETVDQAAEKIRAGGGAILNIGTVGAFHGGPLAVHSASAKAGVLAMTRTLAVEWGRHNIRLNVLTPGATAGTGAVAQLFPHRGRPATDPRGRAARAFGAARGDRSRRGLSVERLRRLHHRLELHHRRRQMAGPRTLGQGHVRRRFGK